MSKKISREQILGELGVNLVQKRVLQMGFTWHPSNQPVEAGIDGWVELRDNTTGEVANCWLAVQSRARSTLPEDEKFVKYTPTQKDLEYWLKGTQPVILVVSKPEEDLAWWVSVKEYFRGREDFSSNRMIRFDKKNDLLTQSVATRWKQVASDAGSGVYFTPPELSEELSSNLLRVWRWPPKIYSAVCKYSGGKEVNDRLRDAVEFPRHEWYLGEDNQIISFHDLSTFPWNTVCDSSQVTETESDRWAFSTDGQEKRQFVRLLNQCLRAMLGKHGIRYSKEENCYYFKPGKGSQLVRRISYKSRKKQTARDVVTQLTFKTKNGEATYFRHDGLETRFLRFDSKWYMMIEPRYVFTTDGMILHPYREERQATIKSLEGDAAVSGKIVMYADLLKETDSLFDASYDLLSFDKLETAVIEFGIEDDIWAKQKKEKESPDTPESRQMSFGKGVFDES